MHELVVIHWFLEFLDCFQDLFTVLNLRKFNIFMILLFKFHENWRSSE